MNLTHIRYAIEVSKTGSISKAADNLFMSQPNLSKVIRELETTLGFLIFKRSSRGITTTTRGAEFLNYSKAILNQINQLESMYSVNRANKQYFSLYAPRASYIAHSLTQFVNSLDMTRDIEVNFVETNTQSTIINVGDGEAALGIIRFQVEHTNYVKSMLEIKKLAYQPILEFTHNVLISKNNPLATHDFLTKEDIHTQIELVHGDENMQYIATNRDTARTHTAGMNKRIYLCERGSQFDFLRKTPLTFMWVSPCPQELLDCYGLVEKRCIDNDCRFTDALIYDRDYELGENDKVFLDYIKKTISAFKEFE